MSNNYYSYGGTLMPGEKAKAEDVADEFLAAQSGFDLLPDPRPGGDGFTVSFKVPNATDPEHVANLGQLQTIETTTIDARDAAIQAASDASDDKILTAQYRGETLVFRNDAEGFKNTAEAAAAAAQAGAGYPAIAGKNNLPLAITSDGTGVVFRTIPTSAITDFTSEAASASPVQSVNGQTGNVSLPSAAGGIGTYMFGHTAPSSGIDIGDSYSNVRPIGMTNGSSTDGGGVMQFSGSTGAFQPGTWRAMGKGPVTLFLRIA